ncbi:hypothetical protein BDV93DRAFT_611020 [Ceratobasidium sp. AG-I]|nr:hypothetical protein BDV93DRAFT_611020 [Ceratobasidium sp. AG-I]
MPTQGFPNLSTADAEAYELLIVCYVRSSQISEQIRATEPDRVRAKLVSDQVSKDLQAEPSSIVHGTSRSDTAQRAQYLKRCRKVFDGDAKTLYELYYAFATMCCAIQVITELELKDNEHVDFLMNEAHNRSMEILTGRPAIAPQGYEQDAYPNPVAMDLEPGDIVPYTLNGEARECLVIDCGTSYLKGDWFLVKDGPVGGQMEEREITASEMEELTDLIEL